MFTGFGGLIAAAFKGYALTQRVGKKVDHEGYVQSKHLEEMKKTLVLELTKMQNELNLVTAKLDWTKNAPEKTKAVMEDYIAKHRELNKSQQEWLTTELVRIKEKKE